MTTEKEETTVTFTSKHPSPHLRHEARTRLIYALSSIESMSLDEALFQALAAVVKLRENMTPEQLAELDRKLGTADGSQLTRAGASLHVKPDCPECNGTGNATFHPDDKCGACASIFGTPPELIPEGAEEFVSDGFRALRFDDTDGEQSEVRTIDTGSFQRRWRNNAVWLSYKIGELDECVSSAPAHPWLLHWLPRADEPIERAVEKKTVKLGMKVQAPDGRIGVVHNIGRGTDRDGNHAPNWSVDVDFGGYPFICYPLESLRVPLPEQSSPVDKDSLTTEVGDADVVVEFLREVEGLSEWVEESHCWEATPTAERATEIIAELESERARHAEELERERAKVRELEAEVSRIERDTLGLFAAHGICTPAEGFRKAGWYYLKYAICDLGELAKSRESEVTRLTAELKDKAGYGLWVKVAKELGEMCDEVIRAARTRFPDKTIDTTNDAVSAYEERVRLLESNLNSKPCASPETGP